MSPRGHVFVLLANALGTLASQVVVRDAKASNVSIAPAAATVSAASIAGVELFGFESIQLTDEVLQTVISQTNETDLLAIVGFENGSDRPVANDNERSGACKTFPGDWNFPLPAVWSLFDALLGGALIRTVPIAAPCYKDFGVFDARKCADISARFTTADLQ